jgi:hypothetical protein
MTWPDLSRSHRGRFPRCGCGCIGLRVSLLLPAPHRVGDDRHLEHLGLEQRLFHRVEPVRLDVGNDQFHGELAPPNGNRTGKPCQCGGLFLPPPVFRGRAGEGACTWTPPEQAPSLTLPRSTGGGDQVAVSESFTHPGNTPTSLEPISPLAAKGTNATEASDSYNVAVAAPPSRRMAHDHPVD